MTLAARSTALRAAGLGVAVLALAALAACGRTDSAQNSTAMGTAEITAAPVLRITAEEAWRPVVDARRPATQCPVHGDVLLEALVPIGYGNPVDDSPDFDSVACPYVGKWVSGGCQVEESDSFPWQALVMFCPRCRAERPAKYAAAHPGGGDDIAPGQDEPDLQLVDPSGPLLDPMTAGPQAPARVQAQR